MLLPKLQIIFKATITVLTHGHVNHCMLFLFRVLLRTQTGASTSWCDYNKFVPDI